MSDTNTARERGITPLETYIRSTFTPVTAARLLDEYDTARRTEVLTEGADELDRIADETETRVAEYYGLAFGVGSAEMVRECARTIRNLPARTTTASTTQEQP